MLLTPSPPCGWYAVDEEEVLGPLPTLPLGPGGAPADPYELPGRC